MPIRNNMPKIEIIWEHIADPQGKDLLRRAIQLILRDPQASTDEHESPFDKKPQQALNEVAPVESNHPTLTGP